MKRNWLLIAFLSFAGVAFAYNPPVGGQSFLSLADPVQLSAASAAGGGIFTVNSGSIIYNPALTAYEDRPEIDMNVTAIANAGAAFQMGTIIPTRMFVISGFMNGTFCDVKEMDLGNSFNLKAGLAKQVTEKISVGADLYTGIDKCLKNRWALGLDIGALYRRDELGFLKDLRVGAAVLGLGKNYKDTHYGVQYKEPDRDFPIFVDATYPQYRNNLYWLSYEYDKYIAIKNTTDYFPGFHTVRAGVAANLFKTDNLVGGASTDFTVVGLFQDAIFDFGFQLAIKENLVVRVNQTVDVLELKNGKETATPAIGVAYKMKLGLGSSDFVKKHGWEKSEIRFAAANRYMTDGISAISAGANLLLGTHDSEGPSIQVFEE